MGKHVRHVPGSAWLWACQNRSAISSLLLQESWMQPKANAANLVAQLQVEIVDRQQRSTKLADSETIKNELEAMVPFCRSNFMLY